LLQYIVVSILLTTLAAVIPCLAANETTSAKDLTYIADSQLPPYNYLEDGKLQGITVDLLEKMWEGMGVDLNRSAIKLLPWTEGYQRTLEENNTVLLATIRIPEREHLFKWVGPAVSGKYGRYVLLAKSEKNITVTTPGDLNKYKIGTVKDTIAVQLLQRQGVNKEDLVLETEPMTAIDMLKNGTIDAIAFNEISSIWLLQQSGANASDYKVAYDLNQGNNYDVYYALNNGTSDSLVQSFQQALDYIRSSRDANGVSNYDKILSKYIPTTLQ
jgi:polar amino acid transport system substrate-binding protein